MKTDISVVGYSANFKNDVKYLKYNEFFNNLC
jgi:hypothetical protein